jgi:hypothetical protein
MNIALFAEFIAERVQASMKMASAKATVNT